MKKILFFVLCLILSLSVMSCNQAEIMETTSSTTTDDNDPYTFETVSAAKSAIKKDPSFYENNQIAVKGTILKRDNGIILSDYRGNGKGGAMFRVEALRSPNITIVMFDKKIEALLEDADYVKISGTVKISDTEIYLDICKYEMIESIYD